MNDTDFREYELPAPAYEDVAAEYEKIAHAVDDASSSKEAIGAVEKWDALRRRLASWSVLVTIRFQQDTRNEEYKQAREYRDELEPKLINLAVAMKRRLLESSHRKALEARFGSHPFNLWRCDVVAF